MGINQSTTKEPERAVNLTWTWYLFLFANVLLMLGIAITWGIYGNGVDNRTAFLPIIICNSIAIITMGVFYFFDARDIYLIRQHIPRKYFYSYFISGFIFVFNLIVIFVYIALIHQIEQAIDKDVQLKTNIIFGILFGIAAIVSLVTIGMYRYAKFRIDLTLYRRRHGENDTRQDQTSSGVSSDQATSGLTTDNVSKK